MLGVLGEEQRLTLVDVEDAARAFDEQRVEAACLLDLRGQPDRVALVPSGGAVNDAYAHGAGNIAPGRGTD